MEGFLIVTNTEDWYGFGNDVESYLEHSERFLHFMKSEEQDLFSSNVRKWSELFGISYMNFRGRVKDIALKNHLKCGLPIKDSSFCSQMTSDQIAFITDDDDWYNPSIASEVCKAFEENSDVEFVYWDSWQYHTCWLKERFCIYDGLGSNAFAIRGGDSSYLYTTEGRCLNSHSWLPHRKGFCIPDKALSVWNIHAASLWQRSNYPLHWHFFNLKHVPRPAVLDWAEEEIGQMRELVKSLKSSALTLSENDHIRLL